MYVFIIPVSTKRCIIQLDADGYTQNWKSPWLIMFLVRDIVIMRKAFQTLVNQICLLIYIHCLLSSPDFFILMNYLNLK
jgi:hypothetical protein